VIRICFIIDKLNRGGAERQFIELVKGFDRRRFTVSVIVLGHGGDLRPDLENQHDLDIYTVPRKKLLPTPAFLTRLYRVLKHIRPSLMYGFMGGTNEICLLMGRFVGARVIWGIRNSNMDLAHYGWTSRLLFTTGALLSRHVDLIIVNSSAGRDHHASHGYASEKMVVIPNGINTTTFFPDQKAGHAFRSTMGIGENEILIGHVGRIDPMKDHETFLRAASLISNQRSDLRFLCVGDGEIHYRERLRRLSRELGLEKNLLWTGMIEDMTAVYNGIDILTSSSSFGEGFPNVIGEAMACGRICVVTYVGDSSLIVGETGEVVPPRDPHALVDAWEKVLVLSLNDRMARGEAARKRILDTFTTAHLVRNTSEHLLSVVERGV